MPQQPFLSTEKIEAEEPSPSGTLWGSRRQFLKQTLRVSAVSLVGAGLYAWQFEPHWVEVTHRVMPLANLPTPLVGRRLVQLSDLHVGTVVDNRYLRKVCQSIAALEPDFLALTGDFMTCQGDEQVEKTLATLRELPLGLVEAVAVLGNHDYGLHYRNLAACDKLVDGMRRLGIHVLRNESIDLNGLQFSGCDDLWAGENRVHKTFASYDDRRAGVALAHNPDLVDLPGWGAFKGWILSGHTHGGQCRLPLFGAPFIPVRNKAYCSGHIHLGPQRDLYVNRGVGYKERIRFGVRPEVTVFELADA